MSAALVIIAIAAVLVLILFGLLSHWLVDRPLADIQRSIREMQERLK